MHISTFSVHFSFKAQPSALSTHGDTVLPDGDAQSDGGMVEERIMLSSKRSPQYSARPPETHEEYVPFAQQVTSSGFPTSPMSSQRPPSAARSGTSTLRKQQLVRSGAAPISHDILDKSRENFTEPGEFKPRTVRYANVQSALSASRNYNPPRKRNNRTSSDAPADGVEGDGDPGAQPTPTADQNQNGSGSAPPRQAQAYGTDADVVSKRQSRSAVESARPRHPSSSAERPQLALDIPPDPDKLKWLREQSQMAVVCPVHLYSYSLCTLPLQSLFFMSPTQNRKSAGALPYEEQVRSHQQQQRSLGFLERERLSEYVSHCFSFLCIAQPRCCFRPTSRVGRSAPLFDPLFSYFSTVH